jgi:large subunit ribosomal protein L15
MFDLTNLNKTVTKSGKRVGRGEGSNRGKNAGKGHKGQTKHGGRVPIGFEGGQEKLMKKTPKFKGFKQPVNRKRSILNLAIIERSYQDGETVSLASLLEKNLIEKHIKDVRVVKTGNLTKKISFASEAGLYLTKGVKEVVS